MRITRWNATRQMIAVFLLTVVLFAVPAEASYLQVDVLQTTSTSSALPDLNLGNINLPPTQAIIMPFYLRIFFPPNNNTDWGIEVYTNNRQLLGNRTTSDEVYRGLRNTINQDNSVPLYWQAYAYDLNIGGTYRSLTVAAEALGLINDITRREQWGVIYDRSDNDNNRMQNWADERPQRTIVSVDGMGSFPERNRTQNSPPIYLYIGGDLSAVTQDFYTGRLVLDFFNYPFNFNTGCYVTPNPFKPVLGQRAYFNFYTNSPDSQITIKIFDPTGFPVVTLRNTRYWDGRNGNYQYVEGGLYLYQIEVEGRVIGGTVVVIK